MKILFYNMAYGTGLDGSWKSYRNQLWRFLWVPLKTLRNITQMLKQEDADVVCLVEIDDGSFRNRFRSQVKQMKKKLNMAYSNSQSKYKSGSIWRFMALLNKHHDAILSKRKGQTKNHQLKSGMKKLVQEFVVDGVSIFTVHLAVLSKRVRKKQMKELAEIIRNCPRPHLLCGDFNIQSGLDELSELLENTKLRCITKTPTFPSVKPNKFFDLFFASPDVNIKRTGILPVNYSDHLPIWVEIVN